MKAKVKRNVKVEGKVSMIYKLPFELKQKKTKYGKNQREEPDSHTPTARREFMFIISLLLLLLLLLVFSFPTPVG